MKHLMKWAAALIATAFITSNAASAGPRSVKPGPATPYFSVRGVAHPRPVETMDTIRANDLDPANNYRGYPDWARKAFAPKN